MACCPSVLQTPEPHGHVVQFHDNDVRTLTNNVCQYLFEGLKREESALVVVTPQHWDVFLLQLRRLGANPEKAIADSRLVRLDAERTLGEFMMDGQPDWHRFEKVISAAMRKLLAENPAGLRAYGEMVGVLWKAGQYSAAIRLEEFWNRLLQGGDFSLFCSYPIDIFSEEFQTSGLESVFCDHTHVIPTGMDETLGRSINRAMDKHLGARARELKSLISQKLRPSRAVLPKGEGMILWLRDNLPRDAEAIVSLARQYYRAAVSEV
ncbi:MAG TPA: MEDS domain-containing protein [Bryobacteraceae bacterium]|nr:MEDS domain-containing protein [Bryobacteraceae bacterium]